MEPGQLERVFVTHLHGDHTAGWPFLLLHLMLRDRRTRALEVLGPPDTAENLAAQARLAYGALLAEPAFELNHRVLPVEVCRDIEIARGLTLDTYPMEHHPSSIGYRFAIDGRTVAVSGDTAWCPALEALANGSELLIVECSSVEPEDLPHVSLRELRERRERLAAPRVVLTHLTDAVAADLARDPIRGTVAAHDRMVLEL